MLLLWSKMIQLLVQLPSSNVEIILEGLVGLSYFCIAGLFAWKYSIFHASENSTSA